MFEFEKKLFDVEHSLLMHAHSYVVLPAAAIYEKEMLKQVEGVAKNCHIYVIGHTPRIFLDDAQQTGRIATLSFRVEGRSVEISSELPENSSLIKGDKSFRVIGTTGEEYSLDDLDIAQSIRRQHPVNFNVLYIGQAYGKSGERAALDRLEKHETLQKIALQGGTPADHELTILLLEIIPANRMMTSFNPYAIKCISGEERIKAGLDKLYGTSEKERVALYEASLIRYFQPRYNKEFKDSFPSTDLKLLTDCYDKDFSGVVAEINFDDLPWDLMSDKVQPARYHIAKHNLHTAEERSMFFSP
jgi:hypothetical protein